MITFRKLSSRLMTLQFDPTKPTDTDPNYYFPIVMRGYGQMNLVIHKDLFEQYFDLNYSEQLAIGYTMERLFNAHLMITGTFIREKKKPNSPKVLRLAVSAIDDFDWDYEPEY